MKTADPNNSIIIYDWILDELKLSGIDLLIYTTIYSNCISNNNRFIDKYQILKKITGLTTEQLERKVSQMTSDGFLMASNDLLGDEVTYSCQLLKQKVIMSANEVIEVFNHWNSKNIIKHKELNEILRNRIIIAIKRFGKEKILTNIDRYSEILKSNFFFDYRWSLTDFLKRKDGIDSFSDDGSKWNSYLDWCNKNHIRRSDGEIKINSDGSINI